MFFLHPQSFFNRTITRSRSSSDDHTPFSFSTPVSSPQSFVNNILISNSSTKTTMKYSFIFAATAAAYDAYGGYSDDVKSSSIIKPSSTIKPIGYTTVFSGYGKEPVTITTQHQPYPTCVSAGYGAEACDKWEDDAYVSTTIKDCDGKEVSITKTTEAVTVYHTKKTITHSATGKYDTYATPTGGYAAPTGSAYKNGTDGCWYELYEKIEEVK